MFELPITAIYRANIMLGTATFLYFCCYVGQVSAVTAFSPVDWNCAEENLLTGTYTFNPGSVEISFETSPPALDIDKVFLQMEPSDRNPESQGFEVNYIRRIPVPDMELTFSKIALLQPVPVAMNVRLSLVQIKADEECRLTINENFNFSQGISLVDAIDIPEEISVDSNKYSNFSIPTPTMESVWFSASSNDPFQKEPGWLPRAGEESPSIFKYKNSAPLRIALYGDAKLAHYHLVAEVVELLNAIAPELDAQFAKFHSEVTLPIHVRSCEEWERNDVPGGISLSSCNSQGMGGFFAGDHVWLNSAQNFNITTLRHELGHVLGLNHPKCPGSQMIVPDDQGSEFSALDMAGIAVHHDSRVNNQMTVEEAATALGLDINDTRWLELRDNRDQCCFNYPEGYDALYEDYRTTVFTNNNSFSGSPDTDGDGAIDIADAFPLNPLESVDSDGDGIGDNTDSNPKNPITTSTQFLQTTSSSRNVTRLEIVNSSPIEQQFTATLINRDGDILGPTDISLGNAVPANGRLLMTSEDIENRFGVSPWTGPAILEVQGQSTFELMSKLISPSGLVSNTNCVRRDRVLNIEGFNSSNLTYVRFINSTDDDIGPINGTLYDTNGDVIGNANSPLLGGLAPRQQVWITRDEFATKVGAQWNNEAMLEIPPIEGLNLLNLNFITSESTFFNFSCFESSSSGRIYLQTTSASKNVSRTHLVNSSNVAQQYTGTLYNKDGVQLGAREQLLHQGDVAPKGRIILSSSVIETAFGVAPWSGPAVLEVQGTGTFDLMTKLTSPSTLASNTNCVRREQVHNLLGMDSPDLTYVRFINTGSSTLTNIRGSLYNESGELIGERDPVLVESLPSKAQVWRTRDDLIGRVEESWNGVASLKLKAPPEDLRLLNLNFVNKETFFNFSCYETAQ